MIDRNHSTNHGRDGVGLALVLIALGISTTPLAYSWIGAGRAGVHTEQRSLTFEERVVYQRAIEEVYWRHRIWPEENPEPKPSLDQVMPLSTIGEKVEDYLRQSEALEAYWQRPITGEQLQAEMDRMARQTKRPEMLEELWAALGHDPFVIAECLARPVLANRLIRSWYASDERNHGELKRRAEGEVSSYGTPRQMWKMSGEYRELEWVKGGSQEESERENRVVFSSEHWEAKVRELARLFAGGKETSTQLGGEQRDVWEELDRLPLDELSRLQEGEDRFYVAAVVEKDGARLKVATVEWKKEAFAEWSSRMRPQLRGEVAGQGFGYILAKIEPALNSCVDDTWTPTPAPPDPRVGHTAVWTGSEMIVWGGGSGVPTFFNTGGRYDPATDSWRPTSTLNAPSARSSHTAVWTGSEMIVWGGSTGVAIFFNTGGRYDPATDSWRPTSTLNAPSARSGHSAVWTGQ